MNSCSLIDVAVVCYCLKNKTKKTALETSLYVPFPSFVIKKTINNQQAHWGVAEGVDFHVN